MKKYTTVTTIKEQITSIVCDICKCEFEINNLAFEEEEEFVHIQHTYGYGSKYFGDCTKLEIDICEKCMFEFAKSKNIQTINTFDALQN